MTSFDTSIAALQTAYASFCQNYAVQKDSEEPQSAFIPSMQAVSRQIQVLTSQKLHPAYENHLISIEKRWSMVCLDFLSGNYSSVKSVKRLEKIDARLNALCACFVPDPRQNRKTEEKSAAEDIIDLLGSDHVNEHVHELLSSSAKELLNTSPKALTQAKIMLGRIMHGMYGKRLKSKVLDASCSPLYLHTAFLKILLVDMVMRGVDPQKECEWFSSCDAKEMRALQETLLDLKETVMCRAQLSSVVVQAALLSKGAYLSETMEEKLKRVKSEENYSRATHNLVLEHLSPYFNPKNELLLILAACTAVSTSLATKFRLVCHMQGPDAERLKMARQIMKYIAMKNATLLLSLAEGVKEADPLMYKLGVRKVIRQYAKNNIDNAVVLLETLKDDPKSVKLTTKIAAELAKGTFDDAKERALVRLLAMQSEKFSQLALLEPVFIQQEVEVCLRLLSNLASLEKCPFALASMIFCQFVREKSLPFSRSLLDHYMKIEASNVRAMLLKRMISHAFKTMNGSELPGKFELLLKQIKAEDQDGFLRAWALELEKHQHEFNAPQLIARRIVNEVLQLDTLLQLQPAPRVSSADDFLMSLVNGVALMSLLNRQ